MNAKYLILIGILFLLALTGVSAQDNTTAVDDNLKTADESIISTVEGEKLEKTYFYDADTDEEYVPMRNMRMTPSSPTMSSSTMEIEIPSSR